MMSPSYRQPHGALSCEKLRAQMGKWLKVDYSAAGLGERHSDCFHNCLLIKGRRVRRRGRELTPQCTKWPALLLGGGVDERRACLRLSSTHMGERTCDDVILRQGLCMFLFPLALHHTQHGPPGRQNSHQMMLIEGVTWKTVSVTFFL